MRERSPKGKYSEYRIEMAVERVVCSSARADWLIVVSHSNSGDMLSAIGYTKCMCQRSANLAQ